MKTAAALARIAFEASVQDAGPVASRAVAEAAAAYRLSLPAARLAALDAELGRQGLAGHIGSPAAPASHAPRTATPALALAPSKTTAPAGRWPASWATPARRRAVRGAAGLSR